MSSGTWVPKFGFDPTVTDGASRALSESYGQPSELV
jgi:hypothetical protein